MPDRFIERTRRGLGSRLASSVGGVVLGALMFLGSFVVLYWNEGRVNLGEMAENALEISATEAAPPEADEKFVSATGAFTSEEKLGDTYLKEGAYIALERKVEIYAWVEKTETETEKNVGGSETETTTYTYVKEWVENPADSSTFRYPEGHLNSIKGVESVTKKVSKATLGKYALDMASMELPSSSSLVLNSGNVIETGGFKLTGSYLFNGLGSLQNPVIGDLKISYAVVTPLKKATVFGKLESATQSLAPYYGEKNAKLYRVLEGGRDEAIAQLKLEYKIITWVLRLVGFLMMWFGLMGMLNPLSVFLDILPAAGGLSRGVIALGTFLIAFPASLVTIFVSMILHNVIVLIVLVAGTIGGAIYFMKKKAKGLAAVTTG